MPEWWSVLWSYGPRDLLLFSPSSYWRLFELYNRETWPAHIVACGLGIGVLLSWRRGGDMAGRGIAAIMAACWLWVAWAFLWQRYAGINWAARHFALAFVVEAVMLLWLGGVRCRLHFGEVSRGLQGTGLGLFLFALLGYPLVGLVQGRPWSQAEVFGMAPDPTALATLGLVLRAGPPRPWGLLAIPAAWALVSGATLWAMAQKAL
jgi:hypothetical protein